MYESYDVWYVGEKVFEYKLRVVGGWFGCVDEVEVMLVMDVVGCVVEEKGRR